MQVDLVLHIHRLPPLACPMSSVNKKLLKLNNSLTMETMKKMKRKIKHTTHAHGVCHHKRAA